MGGVWQLPEVQGGSFALNYRSPVWHQNTGDNYNNKVFNSPIDTPQQVTAGMTFAPIQDTTVAMDYKWVQWSGTETIGNWPDGSTEPAGFGWVDQHILMLGVEHNLDSSTRLRVGYSYGNSPIEEDNVFANFLFPAIVQQHVTVGGDFDLDEKSTVGFSAYVTPEAKMVDNGTGGTYSGMGKGSYLIHQQYGFQLSYSNEF